MQISEAGVRLDKWLWAARFYKTRSLAAQAVERNKVKLNGTAPKPGKEVRCGDWLVIDTPGGIFEVQIIQLSSTRGPAKVAQNLYAETPASLKLREQAAALRRSQPEPEAQRKGRPTKQQRRELQRVQTGHLF